MAGKRRDAGSGDGATPSGERFDLTATVDGRTVVFERVELWWSEAEPPQQPTASLSLASSPDLPADRAHIEVECPAPGAVTYKALLGAERRLAPLAEAGDGGWLSVDLGRDARARGFACRDWVATEATVRCEAAADGLVTGEVDALLEPSAAKGARVDAPPIRLAGRFRAQAPRW